VDSPLLLSLGVEQAAGVGAGVIGFVLLLGAALALLRNSYLKTTNEQLREVRDDLIARDELKTTQLAEKTSEITAMTARLVAMEQQIADLQRFASARDAVEAVSAQLSAHDEQCLEHHREQMRTERARHRESVEHFWAMRELLGDQRRPPVQPATPDDDEEPGPYAPHRER